MAKGKLIGEPPKDSDALNQDAKQPGTAALPFAVSRTFPPPSALTVTAAALRCCAVPVVGMAVSRCS
jgi:hypothetical protein